MTSSHVDLSSGRVLVTGGTGFIGGRLVERLVLQCHAHVRVLVRNFASAARIARFPVELVPGDVTNVGDVEQAMRRCEVVFHCAYGNSESNEARQRVNVDGTRHVLEAASRGGVKRVVHLSTVMVYGPTADGDLDETAPRRAFGDVYSDSKLDAEKIAFEYVRQSGLPVVVLQPTAVYGPFAPSWTVTPLNNLKIGRVILVNGGDGLCNAVYIDDLVSAMLSAAVQEKGVGEAFLISGKQPVLWRDFYAKYERMLGISATVTMSAADAIAYYEAQRPRVKGIVEELLAVLRQEPLTRQRIMRTREVRALRRWVNVFLPTRVQQSLRGAGTKGRGFSRPRPTVADDKPILPLSPVMVQFCAAKTRVRIDKAERLLAYRPTVDFDSGMQRTEQWARWANMLMILCCWMMVRLQSWLA